MTKKIKILILALLVMIVGYGGWQHFGSNSIQTSGEINNKEIGTEKQTKKLKKKEFLPKKYDARYHKKHTVIKNQGELGTCWAVAATTAMEASLMPHEHLVYSADHVTFHNNYSKNRNDGGEYTMAMAYLVGWQGPVLEEKDPYGDGRSPDGLEPVKHVQEIQLLKGKDIKKIKSAVYQYGAVQSSFYMDLQNAVSSSVFYNKQNSSYCYVGDMDPNHDVVIIGWDDDYPAKKFNADIHKNGAFICQNSWGDEFGDKGIFYVSYEDRNMGNQAVAYTKIEETSNYDHLYQSDLCGWVGQMGYDSETCYFANVYVARGEEELSAVGFYAVGDNTDYEVYMVDEFMDESSLVWDEPVKTGTMENGGYYTVDLDNPIPLKKGQKFAVIVKVHTPGVRYPVATEYKADDSTQTVDITDGEGYASANGKTWINTEESHECNVCLKVYTKVKKVLRVERTRNRTGVKNETAPNREQVRIGIKANRTQVNWG